MAGSRVYLWCPLCVGLFLDTCHWQAQDSPGSSRPPVISALCPMGKTESIWALSSQFLGWILVVSCWGQNVPSCELVSTASESDCLISQFRITHLSLGVRQVGGSSQVSPHRYRGGVLAENKTRAAPFGVSCPCVYPSPCTSVVQHTPHLYWLDSVDVLAILVKIFFISIITFI